jgi:hypothetical protein
MLYKTKAGDSPAKIARAYGLPMSRLIGANPQKPTTVVAGVKTWRSLSQNETINVPTGANGSLAGALGDAISDMIGINPCDQRNVNLVCAAQAVLGVTVDGKWGHGTATAAQALVPGAPGGCSPTPSWWGARGSNKCGSAPSPSSGGGSSAPSLAAAATAALAAISSDPNYCSSVGRVGSPVNTAVHNFKLAWNASNPSSPVPIGTGKYEPVVASALSSALGGIPVPPGCGAGTALPPSPTPIPSPTPAPAPAPVPTPTPINVTPVPGPSGAPMPAAVAALASIDPCNQANAAFVCAAQAALGLTVDGKWGPGTANAVRAYLPGAPPGCSPAPLWWGARGTSKCGGSGAVPMPQPGPFQPPPPPPPPPQPIGPGGTTPSGGTVVPGPGGTTTIVPEKKGLSTGAIVAGAIGAAALVGLIAVAATGKKHHGHRKARRHGGGHKTHRKTSRHHKRRR